MRELGGTGVEVSRIGLGMAALGRPGYMVLGHAEDLAWVVARIPTDRIQRSRIVLMSAELKRLARARRAADALLLKPFAADELMGVIEAHA